MSYAESSPPADPATEQRLQHFRETLAGHNIVAQTLQAIGQDEAVTLEASSHYEQPYASNLAKIRGPRGSLDWIVTDTLFGQEITPAGGLSGGGSDYNTVSETHQYRIWGGTFIAALRVEQRMRLIRGGDKIDVALQTLYLRPQADVVNVSNAIVNSFEYPITPRFATGHGGSSDLRTAGNSLPVTYTEPTAAENRANDSSMQAFVDGWEELNDRLEHPPLGARILDGVHNLLAH